MFYLFQLEPTFSDVKASTKIGPKNIKKYKCRYKCCSSKHSTEIQLIVHQARAHKRKKECEICGQTTSSYNLLGEHMTLHFPNEIKYHCLVAGCDKRFLHKSSYQNHKKNHFGFKCMVPTCTRRGKSFSSRCSLEDHVKIHLCKFNYNCDVCPGKRFPSKRGLTKHKTTKGHIKRTGQIQRHSISDEAK